MKYTKIQVLAINLVRIFIGWHFLYEGVVKAYNPNWTAKGFLLGSEGFLKSFFSWLGSENMIGFVNTTNTLVLISVGALLIAGFWIRYAAIAGIVLLLMYYMAYPAIPGIAYGPSEGSYWLINKNLVELAGLVILFAFSKIGYHELFQALSTTKKTQV